MAAAPSSKQPDADIASADTTFRTLVFIGYGLLVLLGVVAWRFLVPAGLSYLQTLDWKRLLQTLRVVFMLFLLSFSPAAVYLIVVGRRVLRHGCWPYPGRKVMFDTRVLRGKAARKRGHQFLVLGYVFLVMMVASMAYVYVRYSLWLNSPLLKKYLFHEEVTWVMPRAGENAPS